MLNVNCSNLRTLTSELKGCIDEVENNQLNLFQNIRNTYISWHDGNSLLFKDYMEEEGIETEKLQELIKNRESIFKKIYDCYSQFGNKLKCDIYSHKKIVESVKGCITQCTSIRTTINSMRYNASFVSTSLARVEEELSTVESIVSDYFKRVIEYEREILTDIKNIENIAVKAYSYELVQTGHSAENVLDIININKDIDQIKLYLMEEQKSLSLLFSKFFDCIGEYNSENTSKLSTTINELKSESTSINSKRIKYVNTLLDVEERYVISTKETINIMSREV